MDVDPSLNFSRVCGWRGTNDPSIAVSETFPTYETHCLAPRDAKELGYD